MKNVIYLFLRRLRAPLITLIVVYAISILGFVLIPGRDTAGQPFQMDFFHAFYFVSFMGSTIGFGEIPYEFTAAQRLWTLVSIYATVIAWLYGIGSSLALLQEPMFGRLLRRRSFARAVIQLDEPFYLICGYGVTGSVLVKQLLRRDIQVVVLDVDSERIDALEMDDLPMTVPALAADASLPDVLDDAGLQHLHCIGVMALTNNDQVNLSIAIASKLLCPERMVISRTESDTTRDNLHSFGTDLVVDPYRTYAEYLSLAAHAPYLHLVYDWIHNPFHRPISSVYQRTRGRWIICGYGRFGAALYRAFDESDVALTVVDVDARQLRDIPHAVEGVGTQADTLLQAGVNDAVGIVAATGNDADNLSIIMTARELNAQLLTVVRQNIHANNLVFRNSGADFVMEPGRIIANRILAHVKSPLLPQFIELMLEQHDDDWARELIQRMNGVIGAEQLDCWSVSVSPRTAPALAQVLEEGSTFTLEHLLLNPHDRTQKLSAFAILLQRDQQFRLLPDKNTELESGDEILLCGLNKAFVQMKWSLNNYNVIQYLMTGDESSQTVLSALLQRFAGQSESR